MELHCHCQAVHSNLVTLPLSYPPRLAPLAFYSYYLIHAQMMPRLLLTAILSLTAATSTSAWVAPNNAPIQSSSNSPTAQDRRAFLTKLVVGTAAPLLVSSPALAAAPSQEQKDKENIVKGYNRLQYFLDNWEKETTVCKVGQEVSIAILHVFILCTSIDSNLYGTQYHRHTTNIIW